MERDKSHYTKIKLNLIHNQISKLSNLDVYK